MVTLVYKSYADEGNMVKLHLLAVSLNFPKQFAEWLCQYFIPNQGNIHTMV